MNNLEMNGDKELLQYFNGDSLACDVWKSKYQLKSSDGVELEKTPKDMHKRLAKEFARKEFENIKTDKVDIYNEASISKLSKFGREIQDNWVVSDQSMIENDIFSYFDQFKYIVPQGSIMSILGNKSKIGSLSNCFYQGTKIFTTEGVKNIEDVQIGDYTVTHEGRTRKVVQLHKNKLNNRTLFNLKTYKTPKIIVTDNHKFLSISKEQMKWNKPLQWNTVDYLREGDYIAIPNNKVLDKNPNLNTLDISSLFKLNELFKYEEKEYTFTCNEFDINLTTVYKKGTKQCKKVNREITRYWNLNENFHYFIGLWYGDGCIFSDKKGKGIKNRIGSHKNGVRGITFTFNMNEKDIIEFVTNYGESLFGIKADVNINEKQHTCQIVFHSSLVGIIFETLFGRYSYGKSLWKEFNKSTDNELDKLIQGLVDSDGTITKEGDVRVVLANDELVQSFYHLLRSRGYLVGYTQTKTNSRLDFLRNSVFIKNSKKYYLDNRTQKEYTGSHSYHIKREGYILVEIQSKTISDKTPEYVYTIGVDEDHSYSVEGLISLNCYVIPSPQDSYGGILKADEHLVQLMKRRGGVGTNLSTLRPNKTNVSNAAGTSTGATSFMHRYSNSTREVAQDGRRGALMLLLHCVHPDIFDFVKIKQDRTKVTGANISTLLNNTFLHAAKKEEDFYCRFPIDEKLILENEIPENWKVEYNKLIEYSKGKFLMRIHAKELMDLIMEMAWESAEPGVAFIDRIINFSPDGVYEMYKAIAANPCGEQWLQAYDSCRLMALNLFSIVDNPFTKKAKINYEKLYEVAYMQQRLADTLVDLEIEHVERIINKIKTDPEDENVKRTELELWGKILETAKNGRRTGCGFTALGDMLAALNLKYDSVEAKTIIKEVCKVKMQAELDCTIDLAVLRGTFYGWDPDKEKVK